MMGCPGRFSLLIMGSVTCLVMSMAMAGCGIVRHEVVLAGMRMHWAHSERTDERQTRPDEQRERQKRNKRITQVLANQPQSSNPMLKKHRLLNEPFEKLSIDKVVISRIYPLGLCPPCNRIP